MKQNQLMAAAALAAAMFISNGAMAADQEADADNAAGSVDQRSQAESADSSAQQAGARAGHGAEGRMSMDHKFAKHAMMMNQFEIQSAQLAQRQAQDQNVKQLAAMILKDHQQAQQKLQQLSMKMQHGQEGQRGQSGQQQPGQQQSGQQQSAQQQLGPVHQAMLQDLQQKQGMEFDRAFLYGNIAGHTKAVLMFRDAAKECQDEQLKQYAQQTLPALKQHLEHAKQIAQFDDAQSAGASERGSGIRSGSDSHDRSNASTPSDTEGTDTQNRRGAGTNDTGGGASSDSGSSGRSPAR